MREEMDSINIIAPAQLIPCSSRLKKLTNRTKQKKERKAPFLFGWDGRIRTDECGSQSPVPYRLATPQYQDIIS